MVTNKVVVNMDDEDDFWYCVVTKEDYSVILLCDTKENLCYTFGGSCLNICKNIKKVTSTGELYDVLMRKIGKMCKKDVDHNGHYFSNLDCYVDNVQMSQQCDIKLRQIIEDIKK